MTPRLIIVLFLFDLVTWAQVTLRPTDDVPRIVSSKPAGTTFLFTPGTYRLSQSIKPKDGDHFIGQTSCAPPATPCSAIISGGVVIGPSATFDGTNYEVAKQTQQGSRAVSTANFTPRRFRPSLPASGGSTIPTTSSTSTTTRPAIRSRPAC
jgi:hypothetical protein